MEERKDGTRAENHVRLPKGAAQPLLGKDEEFELIRRAKAGDARAMDTLLRRNSRLALSAALKHRRRGLEIDDLYQAAMIGVGIAVLRFDDTRGTRLATYAQHWMRAKINRAVLDGARTIYVPQMVLTGISSLNRETQRRLTEFGERPSDKSLIDSLGVDQDHFDIIRETANLHGVPLDQPLAGGNELTAPERHLTDGAAGPECELLAKERRKRLSVAIRQVLTPIEMAIVRCRFIDDLTLEDTAARLAPLMRGKRVVTRERIRQIEVRLLDKLRHHLTGKGFA